MATKAKIGVLGASGYTGGELCGCCCVTRALESFCLRPNAARARQCGRYFRSSRPLSCPRLSRSTASTGAGAALDIAFCALPHATTQKVMKDLLGEIVVDESD